MGVSCRNTCARVASSSAGKAEERGTGGRVVYKVCALLCAVLRHPNNNTRNRQKAVQAAFEDALGRVRADIKSAATVTPRGSFASGVVASSAECRALVHLVSADLWLPAVVQRQPGGGATCVYADKSTETDVVRV